MACAERLLIVNPNTSEEVTARFLAEARRHAPESVTLRAVTGRFGAAIVSTRAENAIAAHAALELLARHGGDCDAAILAISFDTALDAARDVMPIPVVGVTEAAAAEARAHGRVGAVIFGRVSLPPYGDLLGRYGIALADIEIVNIAGSADYFDEAGRDEATAAAADRLAARGVDAVVICGAALVGVAERLRGRLAVPVFDGAAPAVAMALRLARDHVRRQPARPLGPTRGLDPDLAALIAGRGPGAGRKGVGA